VKKHNKSRLWLMFINLIIIVLPIGYGVYLSPNNEITTAMVYLIGIGMALWLIDNWLIFWCGFNYSKPTVLFLSSPLFVLLSVIFWGKSLSQTNDLSSSLVLFLLIESIVTFFIGLSFPVLKIPGLKPVKTVAIEEIVDDIFDIKG